MSCKCPTPHTCAAKAAKLTANEVSRLTKDEIDELRHFGIDASPRATCTYNCAQGRRCDCRDLPAPTQPRGGTPPNNIKSEFALLLCALLVVVLIAAFASPLLAKALIHLKTG